MSLSKLKRKEIYKNRMINNKKFLNLTLIILIFFIFFQEFNIFKNVFDLVTKKPHERATVAYKKTFFSGYCEGSSHGYLMYIKNKYSDRFKENLIPKIVNNFNGKKEYWIFLNVNANINNNQIIILGKKPDIDLSNYNIIDQDDNGCFFIEKIKI